MAFMELMTDKAYYPQASTWYVMPKLAGSATPIPWISTHDVGAIAAMAFSQPERFIGRELRLTSDVKSLHHCRAIYGTVIGRAPPRFPMPVWLLKRFAGSDVIRMWKWLRSNLVDVDPAHTHAIHPQALDVAAWLRDQRG
jgi:hypothetical protein